ncbi:putative golgi matrix protein [Zalerion maritima]|uniref:Golgi matrix protein n=1 Tax=Zalerion maritima TaxID=339359 RepID=A0AAD5WX02_9PEZI|nr:putative golgi matrix protein [Zalerion maritima]
MSSSIPLDPTALSSTGAKKKNKKKKNQKPKSLTVPSTNSAPGDDVTQPESPRDDASDQPEGPIPQTSREANTSTMNLPTKDDSPIATDSSVPNGHASSNKDKPASSTKTTDTSGGDKDTSAALEAMTSEREALRAEVEELRKQLETIQMSHESETQKLGEDLEESESAREEAETQYENLQERVSQIKSSISERLQRDKEQLEEAKSRIDELETANEELERGNKTISQEAESLKEDLDDAERELGSLRSRNNLSQTNWQRERDDLVRAHVQLKEELASTASAMGEWEVIAMEERARRESLGDKMAEFEEQVSSLRDALDKVTSERDTHAMAVDGLQRALQEIQDARKLELREMVESTERQLGEMRKSVGDAEARAVEAASEREKLESEVERTAPFEKEVKEKNLIIGKLRHEAIVLNDHLTKALKYLKKMQPDNQVDRQIISNYLIQFLSLDRADQKRFEILSMIGQYLNWSDDEKAKVGLKRGGLSSTGGSSLRLPPLPFHRTPSTPSLNTEFFTDTPSSAKESLADLWAGFLERGAEEAKEGSSRKDSVSTAGGGGFGDGGKDATGKGPQDGK